MTKKSTVAAPQARRKSRPRPPRTSTPAPEPSLRVTTPSDENGIGAMDRIVGMHISLARGAVYRHFAETFTEIDLTQKQVAILWLIDDNPGVAQADLGRRLQIDRATVMAIINKVQDRGYIVRGRSKVDARRQTLTLTRAGHKVLVEAREAILEHEGWLKGRFTDEEVATLVSLLRRIHE